MKRKSILCILAVIVIIMASLFVACNQKRPVEEASDISRVTLKYYAGESELFAVSVESGERERQFIADGKTVDVVSFCELKVIPLQTNDCEELSFEISGEDKTLSGTLKDPSHGEFVGAVELDFAPAIIKITAGEETSEIELQNVLDGKITADEAIEIARGVFRDKLSAEGEGSREVYSKLITGDRISYYYYVSLIGEGVDYWAALIDPSDGSVVSKK